MDMRKLYDLKHKRAGLLAEAEADLEKKDLESWRPKMKDIKGMSAEIEAMEDQAAEEGRFGDDDKDAVLRNQMLAHKKEEELQASALDAARTGNEYVNAFAKALKNRIPVQSVGQHEALAPLANALTIGGGTPAGADGGFLVPVEFDNMIQRKIEYIANNPYGGLSLQQYKASMPTESVRMAIAMVIIVPIACVYPFFQKYFISGLTIGSVKE